ncbi:hypothetical protein NC974_24985 [Leptolyngbya sp. SLC-A1]
MGKLLLIFDGFDEMAARVDRQQMINNFWELAQAVVPGAKAILTCRTEHFPEAKEGRALLNAELKASTANLTGESPQFEVLELEKFSDDQIRRVFSFKTNEQTVIQVMGNPQLLDLARRPVMTELILAALPDIEAGKPIDLARVYLYAVRHKMQEDIRNGRTFTSLADKLYFLCELSWEMLSTERMSINYRLIPDRIRRLFPNVVQEDKTLDHWHHDMMGQTMLIRNADGDYSPAHRSLLEFFVAYKLVAQLGVLADDFAEVAREQSHLASTNPEPYTWSGYFKRQMGENDEPVAITPLSRFELDDLTDLSPILVDAPLAKAVLDLAVPMLNDQVMTPRLLDLVRTTRGKTMTEVQYFGGNLITLLTQRNRLALEHSDLSETVIAGVNFANISLRWVNGANCTFDQVLFNKILGMVNAVVFSPDGQFLAIGDSGRRVQLWEAATGRVLWIRQGNASWVTSVSFSPDGKRIVSGSFDNTVRLWDMAGQTVGTPFEGHTGSVTSVSFSPDGKRIVSGSDDKTVRLWDVAGQAIGEPFEGHTELVTSVSFSPDGNRIVSGSRDQTVRLWDVAGQAVGEPFEGHTGPVWSVSFSPDGNRIVSGSDDQTVRLWDVAGQAIGEPFEGHTSSVISVSFSPDGNHIVSGSDDQTVRLWDVAGQAIGAPFEGHTNFVWSVSFSPDGKRIVSGSDDQTVRLWDVAGQAIGEPFEGHTEPVTSVSFSPDGKRIVSGSDDQTVRLWDVAGQAIGAPFEGHTESVTSVSFSPDGKRIVSGSDDKTVRLWDVAGQAIGEPFEGHTEPVTSVSFSPDGNHIVSGSHDQTVRLWDAKTGECLQVIDTRLCAGSQFAGATGLTEAQRIVLQGLGAIDE